MIKIKIHIKPQNTKNESKYVVLFILFVCVVASIILKLTTTPSNSKQLEENQIYSISLKPNETNFYSQLNTVANDYDFLLSEYKKVDIKLLEELLYPPFVKDAAWEINGSHKWINMEDDHFVYFIGISSDKNISGDFILQINKENFNNNVWYNNTINISENNLNIHKLEKIINSCKLIVPYTGIDYMKDAK